MLHTSVSFLSQRTVSDQSLPWGLLPNLDSLGIRAQKLLLGVTLSSESMVGAGFSLRASTYTWDPKALVQSHLYMQH